MYRSREISDAISPFHKLIRSDYCEGDCDQCGGGGGGGGGDDCEKVVVRFRRKDLLMRQSRRPLRVGRAR